MTVGVPALACYELARQGLGPITIAANGVDLAVMGQIAKRLGQPPLGQGIGGWSYLSSSRHFFFSDITN